MSRTGRKTPSSELLGGKLLKPIDVAKELNVHRSMVYKLCARGELVYLRVGADKRIPRAALDAYLRSRLVVKDVA